jgi:CheY-like chemotaxis protein
VGAADAFRLRERAEKEPVVDHVKTLSVLLVEDEVLIRMSTADVLETQGHEVVEAGTGAEALAILADRPVDILLADIGLPGMSGTELAVEARKLHPGLPTIFATGHQNIPGLEELGLSDAILLSKPYDDDALERAIVRIGAHA